jgi:hypothetical protein
LSISAFRSQSSSDHLAAAVVAFQIGFPILNRTVSTVRRRPSAPWSQNCTQGKPVIHKALRCLHQVFRLSSIRVQPTAYLESLRRGPIFRRPERL